MGLVVTWGLPYGAQRDAREETGNAGPYLKESESKTLDVLAVALYVCTNMLDLP